ncbi:MAG: hypothetical protein RL149_159 [Actinomycetota bacterium]
MHDFRIALIDGDAAIRAGRRLMLDSQPDMKVVYEQSDAAVALAQVPDLLLDVLVIDHRLKGLDGVTLARRLVELYTAVNDRVPAIIITGSYFTFELLMASIRGGATELVTQDSPSEELLLAIRKSRRSMADVKLTPFKNFLDRNEYAPEPDPSYLLKVSYLDAVEREVLDAIARAADIQEISEMIGLSQFAIRDLVDQLLRKFGCATIEQFYLLIRDSQRDG